jgi:hypothetical protein
LSKAAIPVFYPTFVQVMKRIVTLLLLFLYTASIAGIGIKAFYCCDKLQSVTASFLPDAKTACGKGDSKTGCCNTKYKFFKVKDSHESFTAVDVPLQPFTTTAFIYPPQPTVNLGIRHFQVFTRSNAPPGISKLPAYIVNCVYRI